MTEQGWLTATHPTRMWWFVEGEASERRLRLVACACCRRIWHLLIDERSKRAVEAAELLADGFIDIEQADRLLEMDSKDYRSEFGIDAYSVTRSALISHPDVNRAVPSLAASFVEQTDGNRDQEAQAQTTILRDNFGNPFRPVAVKPAWLTSDVVALAEEIYEEPAFDRLPIFANALQDAGCDNEDLLRHCRIEEPHVRGCWVVDLFTGRK